jgi:putative flippase GtrA
LRKLSFRQLAVKGAKFALIGGIGTVLNLGILFALTTYVHLYYLVSELIAIVIVFVFNFLGNVVVGNIRIDAEAEPKPSSTN